MEVSVSNQLYVFGMMILCGAMSGFIFDIMRALRRSFGSNMLTTSLADILYWLIISSGIYFAIFTFNYGSIRWYEIIGILSGSVIYFLILSRFVMKIMVFMLNFFMKIFHVIFKIILTPLVFLYKIIKGPLYCILDSFGGILRKARTKRIRIVVWIKRTFSKAKLVRKKS